jgi:hypothetical protein
LATANARGSTSFKLGAETGTEAMLNESLFTVGSKVNDDLETLSNALEFSGFNKISNFT